MAIKGPPSSAGGMKTSKPMTTFAELEKNIVLCVLDVNKKIQEYIEDWSIFPTQYLINYRDIRDKGESKVRREPFPSLDEYQEDPRIFV